MDPKNIAKKWFILGFVSGLFVFTGFLFFYSYFNKSTLTKTEDQGKSPFVVGNMEGVEKVLPQIQNIQIKFSSGEVRIDYNTQSEINWDCDGAGKNAKLETEGNSLKLDFSSAIIDCDITIPHLSLSLEGTHGEVEIRKIQSSVNVKLLNGELLLKPAEGKSYKYNLKVDSGTVDESFESSATEENTINVNVEMKYGSVGKLD